LKNDSFSYLSQAGYIFINKIICLFGKPQLDCPDEIINNAGFPLARE